MASGNIQARGIDAVVEMFKNRDVEAWTIYQAKQFMFKGIGEADLSTILDMIYSSQSKAIYTLKVYEGIDDKAKIKSTTPDDGSFNFMLNFGYSNEEGGGMNGIGFQRPPYNEKIMQRLDQIEAKIVAEPLEEKQDTVGSILMDLLKTPSELAVLINTFKGLLQPARAEMPMIGNVSAENGIPQDEKLNRLGAAIEILDARDAKFIEHLEKLAKLSIDKPDFYKFLIISLEGM